MGEEKSKLSVLAMLNLGCYSGERSRPELQKCVTVTWMVFDVMGLNKECVWIEA